LGEPSTTCSLQLLLREMLCFRYVNTAACISRISYIDGDKGILRYRGYPIEELAAKSTYTEVRALYPTPALCLYLARTAG